VTVTVLGLGAVAGAVYVAESAVAPSLPDCAVTADKVPHELPLQPDPLRDHVRTVPGLELGMGVRVATSVALPPAGTLEGAESCSVKLLVIVTAADVAFEGSATLCAVRVMFAGDGSIPGAV